MTNTMSQSPEGSADDFHPRQPPKSGKMASVSIPRRVRRRFPPGIRLLLLNHACPEMSQSPEGSADDFHESHSSSLLMSKGVSIPRRVRRRFPRNALDEGL